MLGLTIPMSGALGIPLTLSLSPTAPLTRLVGIASLGPIQLMGLLGQSEAVFLPPLGLIQALDVGQSRLPSMLDELRTKVDAQLPAWRRRSPESVCMQERRGLCRNTRRAWVVKGSHHPKDRTATLTEQ